MRSQKKKGTPWDPEGHIVRLLLFWEEPKHSFCSFLLWYECRIYWKLYHVPFKTNIKADDDISVSRGVQTRLKDKDSDVEKRLAQVFWKARRHKSVEQSLPQVEKISKLILGEIRQIRNIVEKERCQVSPAETGSNNGVVVASSAIVKSEIKERPSCNFDRREQSAEAEKLRTEPETFFCCCSWPRTGRLWWFFSYCCFHCDLKIVVDQQC